MPGGKFPWNYKGNHNKPKKKKEKKASHSQTDLTFGEVYANDLARSEINKDKPTYPIGSIIVREKNLTETSETPETIIAMVKRKKGFSKNTGDWEFMTFKGADLQLEKRETKGNCADCHSNAKQNDWVFREYLKK